MHTHTPFPRIRVPHRLGISHTTGTSARTLARARLRCHVDGRKAFETARRRMAERITREPDLGQKEFVHPIWVRDGFLTKIVLPANFTRGEAERLGRILLTFPFE